MDRRLKVLVSAYACNPYRGSEPGIGWGFATAIGQQHDVWVLTSEANRLDIEAEMGAHPESYVNLHFYYVPRVRWLALETIWPPSYLWTYELWQKAAYRVGAALHQQVGFDLMHMVTYGTFRSPGYLWRLDVPLVIGPVEGLDNTPWRYLPMMGLKGGLHFAARNIINSLHKRFLPVPKRAFRKAAGVIAASEGMQEQIRRWYGRESEVICEIGPPPVMADDFTRRQPQEALRISWSAQHMPGKALHLLIGALRRLDPRVDWSLDILGEGPCTGKWRRLATKLGVEERCRWHGRLPRTEAVSLVHKSHVFVITSLHDMTSTVLIEALSQGVPVVCPDHFGFRDVVTDDCGIKMPIRTRRQFESDMAAAIVRLAGDEQWRQRLAEGALRRAEDFSWKGKAQRLSAIYAGCTTAGNTELVAAEGYRT